MAQRRTRSADRGGDQLAEILQRLAAAPRPAGPAFKAPHYEGQGDVEYFIRRFEEVAEANDWRPAAALLHLRDALREDAQDCGRAGNIPAIFTALRARYGLSPREARSRISALKKDPETSLQKHATEVERLVGVAYADLPQGYLDRMVLDTFCGTVGNSYLQRHFLAIEMETVEDAVRAGNEYLQIRSGTDRTRAKPQVRQVEEAEPEVKAVSTTETMLAAMLQAMQQMATQMTAQMERIQASQPAPPPTQRERDPQSGVCWTCGQTGHRRRNCPTQRRMQGPPAQMQGNGPRPQQ